MDRIGSDTTNVSKETEPQMFIKRIGSTTYEVAVHFSQTSTETLTDKITRLIQNEINSF